MHEVPSSVFVIYNLGLQIPKSEITKISKNTNNSELDKLVCALCVCMCIHACMCVNVCVQLCSCVCLCMCVCVQMCVHVYVYACVCINVCYTRSLTKLFKIPLFVCYESCNEQVSTAIL